MNPNFSLEEIFKSSTPEQKILWNAINLKFGSRLAVSILHYQGAIPSSEFITYKVDKIYLIYYGYFAYYPMTSLEQSISYFNENNVGFMTSVNTDSYYDSTAAARKTLSNSLEVKNIYFSRITYNVVPYMTLIGFRIGI